MYETTIVIFCY